MKSDQDIIAELRAEVELLRLKSSPDFVDRCVAMDFLKSVAEHHSEDFEGAVSAFQSMSPNLQYLIHSPHGQALLSIAFAYLADGNEAPIRPVVH